MTKPYIFRFICSDIPEDIINDKGKITKFKEVHCIARQRILRCRFARDEDSARAKAKLDSTYLLADVNKLGSTWYD